MPLNLGSPAPLRLESDMEDRLSDGFGVSEPGSPRLPDVLAKRHDLLFGRRALAVGWLASLATAGFVGHQAASWTHGGAAAEPPSSARGPLTLISSDDVISESAQLPSQGFYRIFEKHFREAKHIDLTHAFSPTSPVWPGFGPSDFIAGVAGKSVSGFAEKGDEWEYGVHGFQTTMYHLTTDQLGTQLDPPAHWNEFGATISDLPATFALRPLVVIDIHEQVAKNASYHATLDDVDAWEKANGRIPTGAAVFFRSDWHKSWETFAKEGLPAKYPGVTLEVLKFLHKEREILFHGHEPLDTDMTPSLEGEAWLMHNNYAQAEGVANLDLVPPFGCLLSVGFAKPLGGTGGYARYVAICPRSAAHGVSIAEAPGAPLPSSEHPLRRDEDGVLRPKEGAEPTEYCAKGTAALGCDAGKAVWK